MGKAGQCRPSVDLAYDSLRRFNHEYNEPSGKGVGEPWANVDLRSTWPTIVYVDLTIECSGLRGKGVGEPWANVDLTVDLAYDSLRRFIHSL